MALAGKHTFGSIGETRVTFIEKKIDENRKDFLKNILEHNGFERLILFQTYCIVAKMHRNIIW